MALDDGIQSARLASHLRKKHEKKTKYATMRRRSIAYSIDSLIVGLLSSGIGGIFKALMPTNTPETEWMAKAAEIKFDESGNIIIPSQTELMSKTMSGGWESMIHYIDYNWPLFLINTILVPVLYFSLFIASERQATPGMRYCKIVITDQYGGTLSFMHAIGRTLCTFLTTLTLGIGFFTMNWHPRKRALHDVLVQTDVRNVLPGQGAKKLAKKTPMQIAPDKAAPVRAGAAPHNRSAAGGAGAVRSAPSRPAATPENSAGRRPPATRPPASPPVPPKGDV